MCLLLHYFIMRIYKLHWLYTHSTISYILFTLIILAWLNELFLEFRLITSSHSTCPAYLVDPFLKYRLTIVLSFNLINRFLNRKTFATKIAYRIILVSSLFINIIAIQVSLTALNMWVELNFIFISILLSRLIYILLFSFKLS